MECYKLPLLGEERPYRYLNEVMLIILMSVINYMLSLSVQFFKCLIVYNEFLVAYPFKRFSNSVMHACMLTHAHNRLQEGDNLGPTL